MATLDGTKLATALAARLPGRVEEDAPLGTLTTYRVGGTARVMVQAQSEADLLAIAGVVKGLRPPLLALGRGSNLLVADAGFPGLVVVLEGAFEKIEAPREVHPAFDPPFDLGAGGAVALPVLARRAAGAGLSGLEFYVGIPGSVGGAVRMNAGGHGRETREVLREARVVDLAADEPATDRSVHDLAFGYRHSALTATEIVVSAKFAVRPDDPARCEARVADIVRWRREHQPGGANAGSVFRNPEGDAAGRLVDACGLKGLRVGGAEVSPRHANFIQADVGTSAADVLALMTEVQRIVETETGVRLEPEVHLVGFEPAAVEAVSGATNERPR